MEIGASPLHSLELLFDPQASVELYRTTNSARSTPTRAHIFSRRLGGSCVVRTVRKDETPYPVGGSSDECRRYRTCFHCAGTYPRSHDSSRRGRTSTPRRSRANLLLSVIGYRHHLRANRTMTLPWLARGIPGPAGRNLRPMSG